MPSIFVLFNFLNNRIIKGVKRMFCTKLSITHFTKNVLRRNEMAENNNAFIKLDEQVNGKVSAKLQRNQFAKEGEESFYRRIERHTYNQQNILNVMSSLIPLVDLGTATTVLNAFATATLKTLASGCAVKFGELGTFYIASKGTVGSSEKPQLTVRFTASQMLKDAVQNVEVSESEYIAPSGSVVLVTDVSTGKTDGSLSLNSSALVEGSSLKVGGEKSGVWFAPVAEDSDSLTSETSWKKVESAFIFNTPSKLLFSLPKSLEAGKYKIVIRSHFAGKSAYERKYIIETISDVVTVS